MYEQITKRIDEINDTLRLITKWSNRLWLEREELYLIEETFVKPSNCKSHILDRPSGLHGVTADDMDGIGHG